MRAVATITVATCRCYAGRGIASVWCPSVCSSTHLSVASGIYSLTHRCSQRTFRPYCQKAKTLSSTVINAVRRSGGGDGAGLPVRRQCDALRRQRQPRPGRRSPPPSPPTPRWSSVTGRARVRLGQQRLPLSDAPYWRQLRSHRPTGVRGGRRTPRWTPRGTLQVHRRVPPPVDGPQRGAAGWHVATTIRRPQLQVPATSMRDVTN